MQISSEEAGKERNENEEERNENGNERKMKMKKNMIKWIKYLLWHNPKPINITLKKNISMETS